MPCSKPAPEVEARRNKGRQPTVYRQQQLKTKRAFLFREIARGLCMSRHPQKLPLLLCSYRRRARWPCIDERLTFLERRVGGSPTAPTPSWAAKFRRKSQPEALKPLSARSSPNPSGPNFLVRWITTVVVVWSLVVGTLCRRLVQMPEHVTEMVFECI